MKKLTALYFSPSGTTKKALESIARGMDVETVEYVNLTDFDTRWAWRTFDEDEVVLMGLPTYNGRLVSTAKEIFNRTTATGTPFIGVITYGNRAYEDALIEMKQAASDRGFKFFAAGVAIGQHTLNDAVAAGRPDADDDALLADFGKKVAAKLNSGDLGDIEVPGNPALKPARDLPISPTADEKCTSCGACAEKCPVKAINPNKPTQTDNFRCILCGTCMFVCENDARDVRHPKVKMMFTALQMMAAGRKELEFYL